jgi:DNA-binding MarR family transcriptional regulator
MKRTPALPPQQITAWRDLLAYNAEVMFRIERDLKAKGAIPLAAYDVLIELEKAAEKKMRMYDLAEACILTKSGITKIVNTLEKQNLLKRERCQDDKRGFFAVITHKGSFAVRKAWLVYKKCIEKYFTSALSDSEIAQLGKILPKLRAHMPKNFMESACSE